MVTNSQPETLFFDSDVEKRVLAGLLSDDSLMEMIDTRGIEEEDFHVSHLRILFTAIKGFYRKYHRTIDRSILEGWCSKHYPQLKTDLVALFTEIKSIQNAQYAKYYADELKSLATKRSLHAVFKMLKSGLENDTIDPKQLHKDVSQLVLTSTSESDIIRTSVFDNPDQRIAKYIHRRDYPEEYKGVDYGMREVDEVTGGMFPSQLNMVFGRTGAGKSRFLFNVACNAALAGHTTLYFTIEMPQETIQHMWESREIKLPLTKIMRTPPQLDKEEEQRYVEYLRTMKTVQHPFHIIDIAQGCTTGLIETEVLRFEKVHNKLPDIVLVDYASLVEPMGRYKEERQKFGNLFKELKEMARAHNIIYYTAAQANRDILKSKKGGAGTEHIAFSDAAAHHCDNVFHIHASVEDEIALKVRLGVTKGRYMSKKEVVLHWDRELNYIGDWGTVTVSKTEQEVATENKANEDF